MPMLNWLHSAIREDEAFNVVVPTGNFGNILAAYYAKKWGFLSANWLCI